MTPPESKPKGMRTRYGSLRDLMAVSGLAISIAAPAQAATAPAVSDQPPEIVVEAPEPRFVAPTRRDKIGRIWAPVMINGHGPFRMVLDRIGAEADDLRVSLVKFGFKTGHVAEFGCTDRGEVLWVGKQDGRSDHQTP